MIDAARTVQETPSQCDSARRPLMPDVSYLLSKAEFVYSAQTVKINIQVNRCRTRECNTSYGCKATNNLCKLYVGLMESLTGSEAEQCRPGAENTNRCRRTNGLPEINSAEAHSDTARHWPATVELHNVADMCTYEAQPSLNTRAFVRSAR